MTDLSPLIAALIEAHRTGTPAPCPFQPLTRAEVLAVQEAVIATLGPVAGFKVGQADGSPPILAPIPARLRVANGGTRTIRDRLGVELEVGFELLRPLPSAALPGDLPHYFRPLVALELVDTRLSGRAAEDAVMKFADFQINAGLVTGAALPGWDGGDFGTVTASLTAGDKVVIDGPATIPGGSALANLAALVTHLGAHCGGLQVGQVVITGSVCGLPWFEPGVTVEGRIEGLGTASVTLG
ncbi:hydratase [Mesobacterium pallidum]|uniref:hydratase n=1 Tax=Mesobacterium pallidum TaxID=2872037 RepID=UPI001EE28CC7|nr:hydratase [Mesobacterium pallidum]